MTYFVFVSEDVKRDSRPLGYQEDILKLAKQIEKQQNIDNLDEHGPFFIKKSIGRNHRLIIRKIFFEDDCLLIFWKLFVKSSSDYDEFSHDPTLFTERFERDFSVSKREEIYKDSHSKPDAPSPLPDPTDSELSFLYTQPQLSGDETDYLILESDDWVRRISANPSVRNSKQEKNFTHYLSDIHALIIEIVEKDIDFSHTNLEIGILFRKDTNTKTIFLISPYHIQDAGDCDQIQSKYRKLIENTFTPQILRGYSHRSYPSIILYDKQLWIEEIERQDSKANLALSEEEAEILHSRTIDKYPLFINGRPGSGKSTILQYLFADYLISYSDFQEYFPAPLYLTYSSDLLNTAKITVEKILSSNAKRISTSRRIKPEDISKLTSDSFYIFRYYNKRLFTKSTYFTEEKYINFPRFKELFDEKFRYSQDRIIRSMAEISWHVIRTYIKGALPDPSEFMDPDSFGCFSQKRKSVTLDTYTRIFDEVWEKWYKGLFEEKRYWDDQDLARMSLSLFWEDDDLPKDFCRPVIFCDEAQDFTRNEIRLIYRMSLFSQRKLRQDLLGLIPFAFAGDPFQTLNPTGFNWDFASEDLYLIIRDQIDQRSTPTLEINYKELQFNYRSRKSIVQLCNMVHLLRGVAFDKKGLKPQLAWFDETSDLPSYFLCQSAVTVTHIKKDSNVIIIPCQEGEETEYVRNDPLLKSFAYDAENDTLTRNILSPMRAKGQEFDQVVIYKFGDECLNNPQYKQLVSLFQLSHVNTKISDDEKIPFEYFMNRLYVAVSRAKRRVLIVDTEEAISKFWEPFHSVNLDIYTKHYSIIDPKSDWQSSLHLVKLKSGTSSDWTEDENSTEELADQFMERGKQSMDSYLLELAAQNYRVIGKFDKQIECEAYAAFYRKDYITAGDKFLELPLTIKAEECYWRAGSFERISKLNNGTFFGKVSSFMVSIESMKPSFEDTNEMLSFIVEQRSSISIDETYNKVVDKILSLIIDIGKDFLIDKSKWEQIYKQTQLLKDEGFLPESCIGAMEEIKLNARPYPEKLELMKKLDSSPLQIISEYDKHAGIKLTKPQSEIVFSALFHIKDYKKIVSFIREYPDTEWYALVILQIISSHISYEGLDLLIRDLFVHLTEQGNWIEALTFAEERTLLQRKFDFSSYEWAYAIDVQFIKVIAKSRSILQADRSVKNLVSKYLNSKLIEMYSAFYDKLTIQQAGSALERSEKIMDCLVFYELVWKSKVWRANEDDILYARTRWLICKRKQQEKLTKNKSDFQRIGDEIERRKNEWGINLDSTEEYPDVDIEQKPFLPTKPTPQKGIPIGDRKITSGPLVTVSDKQTASQQALGPQPNPPDIIRSPLGGDQAPLSVEGAGRDKENPPQNDQIRTIRIDVFVHQQKFEIEIMRNRGKLTIKQSDNLEIVTINSSKLTITGSDQDINSSIKERQRKENFVRYFISAWNVTCILRKRDEQVMMDLFLGEKELELLSTQVN